MSKEFIGFHRVERNREIYRALTKKMSLVQKLKLLDTHGDYFLFERRLMELAKKYGIEIPEEK